MDIIGKISGAIPRPKSKGQGIPRRYEPLAAVSGDTLVINCSGCRYTPDPGTAECIRCMVSTMCSTGSAGKIVLRTGRDLEISGRSGKAVKDAASVMRWSFPQDAQKGRCRMCETSRAKVMDILWDAFPSSDAAEAYSFIEGKRPQGKECDVCILRTRRAIEQIESGLKEIEERMADTSGRSLRCPCCRRAGRARGCRRKNRPPRTDPSGKRIPSTI